MQIETIPIFNDNYAYLVVCEVTRNAALVDPADPVPVLRRLRELNVTPIAIWNTHHHADHTSGNLRILKDYAVEIVGHELEADKIPGLTRAVRDGDLLEVGTIRAKVLHTPGHTLGAISYYLDDESSVFTGDCLFGAGCGRLFEGDPPTMYRSLNHVLGRLPTTTHVYFGHEYTLKNLGFSAAFDPENTAIQTRIQTVSSQRNRQCPSTPSTIAEERDTNLFLRCDDLALRTSIGKKLGQTINDPIMMFAALRRLRDSF